MPQAGVAKLSFDTSGGGMSHYRLRFATTRFFDAIYSMRDTLTCYYAPDFSLRFAVKRADEGGYFLTDELTFFYPEQGATIRSHRYTPTQTKIDTTLVSSSAVVFDMLGFIFYLRTLDWNKFGIGDCAISNVAIGRDLVKVVCRYHGRAVVEREHYQYRTHRFVIEVYDEAFEQSKSATEVWVGDDDNHLPIKIRSKLKIGAVEIYYKSAVNLKAPLTCRIK